MTRQELIERKIAVDRRAGEVKRMLAERYHAERRGFARGMPSLRRTLREELVDLKAESDRLNLQIKECRHAEPTHPNYWFRVAANEMLDNDLYSRIAERGEEMRRGYMAAAADDSSSPSTTASRTG